MKKNGQYVGVDEKYVPADEKYVDNNLNSEVKDDIHNMYKGAKEYISDKDNQEKVKNVGRKGLKIAKGYGIGYLIFSGFIVLIGIVIFITAFIVIFSQIFKVNKQSDEIKENASNIINEVSDKADVEDFNFNLESYSGTEYGSLVIKLLDKVIIKIKKNSNHTITVVYNDITTSNPDEITTLKKQFDSNIQYEVSMDYDSNGYINKITISNY